MALWRIETTLTSPSGGGPCLSTMHFQDSLADGLDEYVGKVQAFWTALRPQLSNQVSIQVASDVLDVDNAIPLAVDVARPAPMQGTSIGSPLPWQTQLVVGWRSAVRSRSGMGRTFIPGMTESDNENGLPLAAVVAHLQGVATNLIPAPPDPISEPGDGLVVFSRKLGQAFRVKTAFVHRKWAYLSSRRD